MPEQTATIIASDCNLITVSKCDLLFLAGYNWTNNGNDYFSCSSGDFCTGKGPKYLHRLIIELQGFIIPEGYTVDHINRNKFNNARSNLRIASYRLQNQNGRKSKGNLSGYLGVAFEPRSKINPWVARITLPSGKNKSLGCYATPEEASIVYQAAKLLRDSQEIQRCLNK